ncbi:MAG TPA: ATP-binding protein [Bryobacteraceae bacterium]|nr:ATP-binding protein [Bryobacteraceae bacterium]
MPVRKRILIVEDDPGVRESLKASLDAPDRQIESASVGLAALRSIESEPFDLIIADVSLIEGIHKARPDAKVVATSAAHAPDKMIEALRERAFTYIGKPFAGNHVTDLVNRALSCASWQDDVEVLSAGSRWLGLCMRSKMEAVHRVLPFLREMMIEIPEGKRDSLITAIREMLYNAIEHGAGYDPEKRVTITHVRTERALLYYVRDPGKGFSLDKLEHAAVSNPQCSPIEHAELRERLGLRPGGFGMLIARQLVDELIYNEQGNEVLLVKYIS